MSRAGPSDLSFLASPDYLPDLRTSRAGAVLIPEALAAEKAGPRTRIIVTAIEAALPAVAAVLHPPRPRATGIHADARIHPTARIGPGASVGAFAVVEAGAAIGPRCLVEAGAWIGPDVRIGEDSLIGPGAVCYPGAMLGERVILKAGAVIGGPGFGYLRGGDGHQRLPHLGACILEDEVEVGSGTCIDRGSFDDTVIGRGTKLDNLVQVGHNVRIGARCLIMATTGIAGSCRIGDDVIIAGGVGVADHVSIGDRAIIGAKSVVFSPGRVAPDAVVSGYPARPHRDFLRAQAALYRLAPVVDRLVALAQPKDPDAPTHDRDRG